jgi:hypothetical protein
MKKSLIVNLIFFGLLSFSSLASEICIVKDFGGGSVSYECNGKKTSTTQLKEKTVNRARLTKIIQARLNDDYKLKFVIPPSSGLPTRYILIKD